MKSIAGAILGLLLLTPSIGRTDPLPPGAVQLRDQAGNKVGTTGVAGVTGLNAYIINPSGASTTLANQGTGASASGAWPFYLCNSGGTHCLSVNSDGSINVDATVAGSVAITNPATNYALETGGNLAAAVAKLTSILSALGSPMQSGGSIGNTSFGISGTLPAFASTPTVNLGTIGGAATQATLAAVLTALGSPMQQTGGSISIAGTPNVAVTSSVLPTGAATQTTLAAILSALGSPLQAGGTVVANAGTNLNTSALALETGGHLSSLDTKTPALGQALAAGSVPVVLPAAQITTLTPPTTITANIGTTGGLALNSTLGSPFQAGGSIGNTAFGISGTLPAYATTPTFNLGALNGAATDAELVTINSTLGVPMQQTGGSLSVTNFPASFGRTWGLSSATDSVTNVQAAYANGSVSIASVTTTASTVTVPSNAIGFILESESGNTANIRWAVGTTATATVGILAEPGRDTGFIPVAGGISLIAISGTQTVDVQWVIR